MFIVQVLRGLCITPLLVTNQVLGGRPGLKQTTELNLMMNGLR